MPPPEETGANHLFEAVVNQVGSQIDQHTADESNRRFYRSLLAGGSVMAGSVVTNCQGINSLWAGGDEAKALATTRLFTIFMLLQCYRWLETKKDNPELPGNSHRLAMANILHFFGDASEEEISALSDIDNQFHYEVKHQTHMVHLATLLLARACQACGYQCIDWSKVSFPVRSLEPLTGSGAIVDSAPIRGTDDITAFWNSHTAGIKAMVNYYEEQAQI